LWGGPLFDGFSETYACRFSVYFPPTGLNRPIFAYFCGGVSLAASARFGETAGKATEKGAWGVLGKAASEHLQNVLGGL